MTTPVTFNTAGKLVNWIANRTNCPLWLAGTSNGHIGYEPSDRPPPEWGSSQITWNYDNQNLAAMDTAPCLEVKDLSKHSVVPGASYLVRTGCGVGNAASFFVLQGVDGGSVLYGAVALYNLVEHPQAWTYYTPQVPGPFAIELNSPYFETILRISVSYVPRSTGSGGPRGARLIHTYEALKSRSGAPVPHILDDELPVEVLRTSVPARTW